MKVRLTGNLLRKSDSREAVAFAWQRLEDLLSSQGFQFSPNHSNVGCIAIFDGKRMLDGADFSKEETDQHEQLRKTLNESRAEFIKKIGRFNWKQYSEHPIQPWGTCNLYHFYIDTLDLMYTKDRNQLYFSILPRHYSMTGKNYPFGEDPGGFYEKCRKSSDASHLIVSLSLDAPKIIAGEVQKTFRRNVRNFRHLIKGEK